MYVKILKFIYGIGFTSKYKVVYKILIKNFRFLCCADFKLKLTHILFKLLDLSYLRSRLKLNFKKSFSFI